MSVQQLSHSTTQCLLFAVYLLCCQQQTWYLGSAFLCLTWHSGKLSIADNTQLAFRERSLESCHKSLRSDYPGVSDSVTTGVQPVEPGPPRSQAGSISSRHQRAGPGESLVTTSYTGASDQWYTQTQWGTRPFMTSAWPSTRLTPCSPMPGIMTTQVASCQLVTSPSHITIRSRDMSQCWCVQKN